MSTSAKPRLPLRVEAKHIGPIMNLRQDLSADKQNLIFARNGTGKSFIARALRFLDRTVYSSHEQSGVSDVLVSEESPDGKGAFRLYEGQACIGSLELDTRNKTVTRVEPDYIFHVFTEDYIDEVVRNRLERLDGEITHEIIIGKETVELDEKETVLSKKQATIRTRRQKLDEAFSSRREQHKSEFAIVASLLAFKKLSTDVYFTTVPYSVDTTRSSVDEFRSQYNALKALPSDPILPTRMDFATTTIDVQVIHDALSRTTSLSTVADDFRQRIERAPEFFQAGVALYDGRPSECPFCTQVLQDAGLTAVAKYVEYFQDEEARERATLGALIQDIQREASNVGGWKADYVRERAKFDQLKRHFPSIADKELADPTEELDKTLGDLGELKACLERKMGDLTKTVPTPSTNLVAAAEEVRLILDMNNGLFDQIGTLTNDSSSERRSIQNLSCKSFEAQFVRENQETIDEIRGLETECTSLSKEVEELKHSHGDSASARDRVASTFSLLLGRFFGAKYTFDSSSFKVRRNNREMRRGSDRTLSDGEKAVLAFCYFLAQTHLRVNELEDYRRLYFVFDDPVTSMSFDYIYTIIQTLKLLRINPDGEIQFNLKADQHRPKILILTHNNYFFNVASANRVVRSNGLFQLVQGEQTHELVSQAPFATPHMLQLRDVRDVASGTKRPDHTTPNSVRSVIEGIWKFCRPDFNHLEEFLGYLIQEHQMEIRSVLLNDLSHGGKVADFPHDEQDIRRAAEEAVAVVTKFAEGQVRNL